MKAGTETGSRSEGSERMCAKQKTQTGSSRSEDTVEPEWLAEALNVRIVESEEGTAYTDLMALVMSEQNLDVALMRVVKNRGSPGIDGMTVEELEEAYPDMMDSLRESVLLGKYKPSPVRRVEIPKPEGGTRNLGIPTVRDRLVMQAINQVLMPIYDPTFSDCSFGFRPGRSAHGAIARVMELYDEGYTTVVSLDLSKYFDTIPQDDLMNILRRKIKDRPLIDLIKRFLKNGVAMPDGVVVQTDEGTPQGSPLSPLLANIYLDRFDKEMENRGLNVVRYADDANVYVRTPRAGERVMEHCTEYLEDVMKLKVNRDKSRVGSPTELKFLGFRLDIDPTGETGVLPHEKAVGRFKSRIREITKRHRGDSVGKIVNELNSYLRGWFAYYGIGSYKRFYDDLDGWIRRRMRAILLTQWKTPKNRQRQLNRIGEWKRSGKRWEDIRWISQRKNIWHITHHMAINFTLTNARLQQETGIYYMADSWSDVQAKFSRSPLPNGTVGSVGGRQATLLEYVERRVCRPTRSFPVRGT